MEVGISDILEAREQRALRQRELLSRYKNTLICFTMNIAGPIKHTPLIEKGFYSGINRIKAQLDGEGILIEHFEKEINFTGCTAFFSVVEDAFKVKKLTCEIEDADGLGRLFDIDVLDKNGEKISRTQSGLQGRKCLICESPAAVCGRSRAHSVKELQSKTTEILENAYFEEYSNKIASAAVKALLFEVATTVKPGLVDCFNSGSHNDMDIFTFLSSASSLFPYFKKCAETGIHTASLSAEKTFEKLRFEGKKAELTMLAETGGINTHKGAIFSMGILTAAVGRLVMKNPAVSEIAAECAKMTKGITFELDRAADTAGKKLYKKYGIKGVRGEVESGFPNVLNIGYPVLKKGIDAGYSLNRSGCAALLNIMCSLEDTNLLNRTDKQTATALTEKIKAVLKENPYPDNDTLKALDLEFIKHNASAGGSADLLSICYFFYFLNC